MLTKKTLARELSRLSGFSHPEIRLEQYHLDSEVAAFILWTAFMHEDIQGKTIADLGSGPGILAVGCLLLGAKKVYLVELDKAALAIAKLNISNKKAVFLNQDIRNFHKKVDVVIQNPPFGTKQKHADRDFLKKAMQLAPKIYSLHKITSKSFITAFAHDHGFQVQQLIPISTTLKATYAFHKKPKQAIELGLWILRRNI